MAVWKETRDYGPALIVGTVFSGMGGFLIYGGLGYGRGFLADSWVLLLLGTAILTFSGFILIHALVNIFTATRPASKRQKAP